MEHCLSNRILPTESCTVLDWSVWFLFPLLLFLLLSVCLFMCDCAYTCSTRISTIAIPSEKWRNEFCLMVYQGQRVIVPPAKSTIIFLQYTWPYSHRFSSGRITKCLSGFWVGSAVKRIYPNRPFEIRSLYTGEIVNYIPSGFIQVETIPAFWSPALLVVVSCWFGFLCLLHSDLCLDQCSRWHLFPQ